MLLWLVILFNSFLPVDLVARILPPDMAIAENVPAGTNVGHFAQDGERDSKFEIVAAMPGGVFDIDPQTSEVCVADSTSLDFESLRHVVLIVRETQAKNPDLYRSLFVDKLLRDGAQPHQLTRFTAETHYRICVVEVTDVDEPLHSEDAAPSPHTSDDNTIDTGRVTLANPKTTSTPEFLILPRQASALDIDQITLMQAYLDRMSPPDTDLDPGVGETVSEKLTADGSGGVSAKLPHALAAPDVETSAIPVPPEIVASHQQPPSQEVLPEDIAPASTFSHTQNREPSPLIELSANASISNLIEQTVEATPTDDSLESSHTYVSQRSAQWWLVVTLVTIVIGACGVFLAQTLHRFEQKTNLIDRLFSPPRPQPVLEVEDVTIAADRDVFVDLDEYDVELLNARDNGTTSQDAAKLMALCLSTLETPGNSCSSAEADHAVDPGKNLAASSASLGDSILSALEGLELESALKVTQPLSTTTDNEQSRSLKEAARHLEAGTLAEASALDAESAASRVKHQSPVEFSQSPGASPHRDSDSTPVPDHSRFVNQQGGDTTTSDEVERLQKLISDEFGIETRQSHDDQAHVPQSDDEATLAQNSGTTFKKDPPPEVDLNDFRQIAGIASQQAIQTAKLNLRQRRIRGFLMYSSLGCSLVCGLAATFLSPKVNLHFLLVSLAALILLGYMMSCRSQDESD